MQVATIMKRDPTTVEAGTTLDAALGLMDRGDFRHLPVVEGGRLVGVVSERDLLEGLGRVPGLAAGTDSLAPNRPSSVGEIMVESPHVLGPDDTLDTAAGVLRQQSIGCLPIVEGETLAGLLTELDVVAAFDALVTQGRLDGAGDATVSARMSTEVVTVAPDTSVQDACSTCFTIGARHLPVVDGDRLVGLVSDRDLRGASTSAHPDAITLDDIMATEVETCAPDTSMVEAARRMRDAGISSLPVLDGGALVGILSLSDVLDHCVEALARA